VCVCACVCACVFSWQYLSYSDAVYCTYESGEDGLLGVCDDHGELCLALALWNGKDHILKERLFGLSSYEVRTFNYLAHLTSLPGRLYDVLLLLCSLIYFWWTP